MNFLMGEIEHYNSKKGFGFLRQTSGARIECFFHINLVAGKAVLQIGDLVVFQINPNPYKPGRLEATNIRLVKRDPAPTEVVEAQS